MPPEPELHLYASILNPIQLYCQTESEIGRGDGKELFNLKGIKRVRQQEGRELASLRNASLVPRIPAGK